MTCSLYLGISLDGYIAGPDHDLSWLELFPGPEGDDLGFSEFTAGIDALVLGRRSYEFVVSTGLWFYEMPVFVLSRSLEAVAPEHEGKAEVLAGEPQEVIGALKARGHERLYIDGGDVVRQFLAADLIDEMVLTYIPVLLGGGVRLWGELPERRVFKPAGSEVLVNGLPKLRFERDRSRS